MAKPESPALGALDTLVGWHLAQASVPVTEAFERHVGRPCELRKVEFSLLALLAANDRLAPKQLAATLALAAPKLTALLDRLQQRGLIGREPNPADGRSMHIVLTERGRRLTRDASKAAVAMEDLLVGRLSRAERAMLVELLAKVARG